MGAPPVLLDYQRRWLADRSPVKFCEKSRRIGITWATAAGAVLDGATAKKDGGCSTWYMVSSQDDAREFILDCARWARAFGAICSEVGETLIEDEDDQILAFVIRFGTGFAIHALSSNPRRLRGKQGHAILDEAAHHDDLAAFLKAAVAFLLWGGRVSLISTHNGIDSEFAREIEKARSGRASHSVHRYPLKRAISDGLYRRICAINGQAWSAEGEANWEAEIRATYGESAAEELDCIPARSGGVYISAGLVRRAMDPEARIVRFGLPPDFLDLSPWEQRARLDPLRADIDASIGSLSPSRPHVLGQDFGRLHDLTAITVAEVGGATGLRVRVHVELRGVPFREQAEILASIIEGTPQLQGARLDAGGNGAQLAEDMRRRFGSLVDALQLSRPWYAQHLPKFRAAFENRAIKIPACDDIAADLAQLRLIDGIPQLPKARTQGRDGGGRHGDAAISLLLAHSLASEDSGAERWAAFS